MNLLAFDTGTEVMSIAVCRTVTGQVQQWQHTGAGGSRASTDLIPAVMDLLQQAGLRLDTLDAVCFGSGPGSFTGLRTACSVAQGLAFGANVPVLPVDSLLAVAEEARFTALAEHTGCVVTAMLDARMDEMYAATYAFHLGQWRELQASALLRPEDLTPYAHPVADPATPWVLAGNVFAVYGDRVSRGHPAAAAARRLSAQPSAAAMLRLAPQLIAQGKAVAPDHAFPTYIRDKVAKTTAERLAEKSALASGVSR